MISIFAQTDPDLAEFTAAVDSLSDAFVPVIAIVGSLVALSAGVLIFKKVAKYFRGADGELPEPSDPHDAKAWHDYEKSRFGHSDIPY